MTFTIKNNSQSFKYLSRWKSNYKAFAEDGNRYWSFDYSRNIATDFCSYYRQVMKLMLTHFITLMLIPSFLALVLCLTGMIYIPTVPTFVSVGWVVFSGYSALALMCLIVGGCIYLQEIIALALMCLIVGGCIYLQEIILPRVFEFIRHKLPERKSKSESSYEEKQPGILSMWYDGFKGNFCDTIKFEVENNDHPIYPEQY